MRSAIRLILAQLLLLSPVAGFAALLVLAPVSGFWGTLGAVLLGMLATTSVLAWFGLALLARGLKEWARRH
jgi:hypothetical protein